MSQQFPIPRGVRISPDYVATAGQTSFEFPFWLYDADDVEVRIRPVGATAFGEPLTLGADFLVSDLNTSGGATVNLVHACDAGDRVRLIGKRLAERTTSVTQGSSIKSVPLERELDLLNTVAQELRRDISDVALRGLFVPEGEEGIVVPSASERLGKIPFFTAEGMGLLDPVPVSIGVPGDGTVSGPKIAPEAVTLPKVDAGFLMLSARDLAELAALPTKSRTAMVWDAGGRNGHFCFALGNMSAMVAADPLEGIYVAPNSDPTGASGAWVRQNNTPGKFRPEWFGAVRGGVNDYIALAGTIDFIKDTLGTGTLWLSGGYRCDTGLQLDIPLLAVEGSIGCRGASLYSPLGNANLITMTASQCEVRNLTLYNNVRSTVASALLDMKVGAVKCTVDSVDMTGGYYCFRATGYLTDTVVRNCSGTYAIGGAIAYLQGCGAVHFDRCLFNQGWPVLQPATNGSQDGGSWAPFQTYATGVFVRTGGFILQCVSGAGTTGATAPVLTGKWYFETITDGGHSWKIANNASACAVIVDSDCTYMRFRDCDFTGAFTSGFLTINNFGTVPPHLITLITCTTAGVIDNGFVFAAGKTIKVEDCEAQVILGGGTARAGFYVAPGFTGNINIDDCKARDGMQIGVRLGNAGGGRANVKGCQLVAGNYGAYVDSGVKDFSFTGRNVFAADGSASPVSIRVEAGASDYYDISGNDLRGSSLPSDAGTGTNKHVQSTVYR